MCSRSFSCCARETQITRNEEETICFLYATPNARPAQKARKWLEEQGISFEERDIKTDNPTETELRDWHRRSGLPLKRFFNTSGLQYKALGLKIVCPK